MSQKIDEKLSSLRTLINENLRTQLENDQVDYISSGHTLNDVRARQSHCIFARRGCGKTLLLHHSRRLLGADIKAVYLNCEDFKHHSFPNVLIEIIDSTFSELERNLTSWFGKKAKLRQIISELRKELGDLKTAPDEQVFDVSQRESEEHGYNGKAGAKVDAPGAGGFDLSAESSAKRKADIELKYKQNESKLLKLNHKLPEFKTRIREVFEISGKLKSIFIQLDDFYQLSRADQPFVADYVHRLCKDTPMKFKIATLKHNSVLYIERDRQPIGIQERHDYQPINIDFTFDRFERTRDQNRNIFLEYAKLAGMKASEFNDLFKGKGFERLVLAGGGVPRDCLSFFLEVLDRVRTSDPNGKIGKDDVRFLSRETFDRRIDELKQDSDGKDQDVLLRGIHALRGFCLNKKSNVFLVSENELQKNDAFKTILYRLLDYRIIHCVATSLTHKSKTGSNFQAYAIDIGCYAYMRNLDGRLNEIDLRRNDAKEQMRSAPVLEVQAFNEILTTSRGKNIERALEEQEI